LLEFINLRQGSKTVNIYAFRFTQLSKYAHSIVVDRRTKMTKFVSGVLDLVVKECRTAMLVHDMDIARFIIHTQQIEEEKLKGRSREKKSSLMDDDKFSYDGSNGHGHFKNR